MPTGTDLVAFGDQPQPWRLEMDFDREFRFVSSSGDSMVTSSVKPVVDPATRRQKFSVNSTKGAMEISLFDENCRVAGSRQLGRKCEVLIAQTRYTGCAAYQSNQGLAGKWVLEKIDDTNITTPGNAADMIPYLLFDKSLTKMDGLDGCNRMSSSLSVEGDFIRFGNIASTKKFCQGVTTDEVFRKWISGKLVGFNLNEEILQLYLGNDSRLVFRRSR